MYNSLHSIWFKWKFYIFVDAFVVLFNTQLLFLATFTCWIDRKIENWKQEHLKTAWNLLRLFPQTFQSELNGIFEPGVSIDTQNQYRIQTRNIICILFKGTRNDENHYVVSFRNVEAFRQNLITICLRNNRQITFIRQRIEVICIYTNAHLFVHVFILNVNCSKGADVQCLLLIRMRCSSFNFS